MPTMTGTTIHLHDWRKPLRARLESRRYVGPYQYTVPTPGPTAGRGYYASDDNGASETRDSMFRLRACEPPRRFDHGWYCDDLQHDSIRPVVLRLPHGRGFLAGWTMGAGMASTIEPGLYLDEKDAWRAADSAAESAAEAEREYQAEERERIEAEEAEEARLDNLAACHPPLMVEA